MPLKDKKGLFAGVALVGAAVATELRKPADERTWHGSIGGMVPYDLRVPTKDRVREKLWNPAGNFWSPSLFGVGWVPNVGWIAARTGLLGQVQTAPAGDDDDI
ncbi:MAG TPA: hypothetical protein VGG16_00050 [Streptosporangiaceae bacterium]|jgi:hypothetical protein